MCSRIELHSKELLEFILLHLSPEIKHIEKKILHRKQALIAEFICNQATI